MHKTSGGQPPKGAAAGIARSLRTYYGDRGRMARMGALYARFMQPGDIVFDIGSHVGDRIAAFLELGARVVAVEPQPAAFRCLRLLYGRNPAVTLVQAAISDMPGAVSMKINTANPTVSTASPGFIAAANGAVGWHGQHWDADLTVQARTLDMLIATYGEPAFIKIDVEGFEEKALAGLSHPIAALSFEFTIIQRDVAQRCLADMERLGRYRFNAALGESQELVFPTEVDTQALSYWLDTLPAEANSGDIYAFRQ